MQVGKALSQLPSSSAQRLAAQNGTTAVQDVAPLLAGRPRQSNNIFTKPMDFRDMLQAVNVLAQFSNGGASADSLAAVGNLLEIPGVTPDTYQRLENPLVIGSKQSLTNVHNANADFIATKSSLLPKETAIKAQNAATALLNAKTNQDRAATSAAFDKAMMEVKWYYARVAQTHLDLEGRRVSDQELRTAAEMQNATNEQAFRYLQLGEQADQAANKNMSGSAALFSGPGAANAASTTHTTKPGDKYRAMAAQVARPATPASTARTDSNTGSLRDAANMAAYFAQTGNTQAARGMNSIIAMAKAGKQYKGRDLSYWVAAARKELNHK